MRVPLSTEQLYDRGNGDMSYCDWDFSIIPAEEYERFFLGLGNVLYKKVIKARFSVDSLRKLGRSESGDRSLTDNSIATRVHRYRRRLWKVFQRVLPETKTLRSLIIDGIDFPPTEIGGLLQTAARGRLGALTVANVAVPAAAFRQFLSSTSPAHFEEIVFQNCGLPGEAAADAVRFLRSSPGGEWKLKSLQLPDNQVDGETQSQIDRLVHLRGAIDLLEIEEEEEEDLAQSDVPIELVSADSIRARVDTVPEAEPSDNPFVENRNLRNELDALLDAAGALRYDDDVFLVGPSADANLKIIRECERIVREDQTDEQ
jgi:hypothetical protein